MVMKLAEKGIFSRLYGAIALILAVQIIGVAGFMLIEGFTLDEAFYMTIIVVSTVGLGAVRDLSPEGRLFIAGLIILSLGTVTYAISIITSYIMDGEMQQYYKYRKVKNRIDKMHDHIIVCGYGRNGKQACEELRNHHRAFVVIESKSEIIEQLHGYQELLYVEGNATHDEVLEEAGIARARALITTLPNDANNVFVVLTARGLNPSLKIISRASEDASFNKLKRAGADNVIMPDKIGGVHMASLIAQPDVLEFVEVITGKAGFDLEEISFTNCKPKFHGMTIGELIAIDDSGANVIGMKTGDGNYLINPPAKTVISKETKLFVLGTTNQVEALAKLLAD